MKKPLSSCRDAGEGGARRRVFPRLRKWQWACLILVAVIGLDGLIQAPDGRSRRMSAAVMEAASPAVRNYPYRFRILRFEGDTAVVSTPRNVEVPAARMLAVIHPGLDTHDANDPAFIAAQQELGAVQSEVRAIVLDQPGIKGMRWELDRDWLRAHYIELPEDY